MGSSPANSAAASAIASAQSPPLAGDTPVAPRADVTAPALAADVAAAPATVAPPAKNEADGGKQAESPVASVPPAMVVATVAAEVAASADGGKQAETSVAAAPAVAAAAAEGAASADGGGGPMWKTTLCSFFRKHGECKHGARCKFAHGEAELRARPDGSFDPTSARGGAKRSEAGEADQSKKGRNRGRKRGGGGSWGREAEEAEGGEDEGKEGGPGGEGEWSRLCVQNIPKWWNVKHFRELLNEMGLEYCGSRKSQGVAFGFVSFETAAAADKATQLLHGKLVKKQTLDVQPARYRTQKQTAFAGQEGGEGHEGKKRRTEGGGTGEAGKDGGKEEGEKGGEGEDEEETEEMDGEGDDGEEGGTGGEGEREKAEGRVKKEAWEAVTPLARMEYREQLEMKGGRVAKDLQRIVTKMRKLYSRKSFAQLPEWIKTAKARAHLPCLFEGIYASPVVDGYRNKCEFSIGPSASGQPTVGFLLGNFRDGVTAVAEPSGCRNISPIAIAFARLVQEVVRESPLAAWDKVNNRGFWRLLTVREGTAEPLTPAPHPEPAAAADVAPMDVDQSAAADADQPPAEKQDDNSGTGNEEGTRGEGDTRNDTRDDTRVDTRVDTMEGRSSRGGEGPTHSGRAAVNQVMLLLQVNPAGADRTVVDAELSRLTAEIERGAAEHSPPLPLTLILVQEHSGVSNAAPETCPIRLLYPRSSLTPPSAALAGNGSASAVQWEADVPLGEALQAQQEEVQQQQQGTQVDKKGGVLVFDVCCGTGTIGLCVAKHSKKVIGIEMNESAVEDARRNAAINDIQHAEFIASRAELVLPKLLHKYLPQVKPAPDSLPQGNEGKEGQQQEEENEGKEERKEEGKEEGKEFEFSRVVTIVDPPRAGLHPTVLRALRENSKIEQLLYISCNPSSLVNNVLDLCSPPPELKKPQAGGGGWSKWGPAAGQRAMAGEPFRPVRAVAVDLFPHTEHCEVVMLLESIGKGEGSKWGPAAGQQAIAGEPFRPVRAVAVDLFPHTEHCEVVMLLER
ncbi:unnamed protein product [Closterium sp. Yama58-4]|nr:unnamed protein product [Closterium sp. Yama58-4]